MNTDEEVIEFTEENSRAIPAPPLQWRLNDATYSVGADLITKERIRQIEELGRGLIHDSVYREHELARAAAAYLLADFDLVMARAIWPWDPQWFHPKGTIVRNLQKGGALAAAAIDLELAT